MRIDNSFFAANRIGPTIMQSIAPEDTNTGFAGGFEKIFQNLWDATNELSDESRAYRAQLMMGTLDDYSGMMIASEKSSTMFELNLAVRNKVIDAYQEIMRTQV